jgi:hypothetical protein
MTISNQLLEDYFAKKSLALLKTGNVIVKNTKTYNEKSTKRKK